MASQDEGPNFLKALHTFLRCQSMQCTHQAANSSHADIMASLMRTHCPKLAPSNALVSGILPD